MGRTFMPVTIIALYSPASSYELVVCTSLPGRPAGLTEGWAGTEAKRKGWH